MQNLNDPAFETVVTQVVDRYAHQIQAKTTRDNADALDKAGHTEAATFLRNQLGE